MNERINDKQTSVWSTPDSLASSTIRSRRSLVGWIENEVRTHSRDREVRSDTTSLSSQNPCTQNIINYPVTLENTQVNKWPDKSTTSYAMLDFESDIENLKGKYLAIERQILQSQYILLQYSLISRHFPYKFSISLSIPSIA